ncbi:MAG: dienelactone hydrolase family protein [Fuerstiella sp.]
MQRFLMSAGVGQCCLMQVRGRTIAFAAATIVVVLLCFSPAQLLAQVEIDSKPLAESGDLASMMVDGIDRFLLKQIQSQKLIRNADWLKNSPDDAWRDLKRDRLREILGARDTRMSPDLHLIVTPGDSGQLHQADRYTVYRVRWNVLCDPAPTAKNLPSIQGEGLMLVPSGMPTAFAVVVPDADETPEQLCGLASGLESEHQIARHLAASGVQVIVPSLISRKESKRNGRSRLTNREYLSRSAFLLGRQLMGYEIQKILSAVDWFETRQSKSAVPIVVCGRGEGGMLAMYAGALDRRISATGVAGYFGPRDSSWNEPLDRNVFGRLTDFGDAEVGRLIIPERLVIGDFGYPEVTLMGEGGAPAQLKPVSSEMVSAEVQRLREMSGNGFQEHVKVTNSPVMFLQSLLPGVSVATADASLVNGQALTEEIAARELLQLQQIDRHNQALLSESWFVRDEYFGQLDRSSVAAYRKSVEKYRDEFRNDVIGSFDLSLLPPNVRSRKTWETDKWTGHEIVLDVFDDVFAYGVLLLPKDMKPEEKRPVVVCQHGLEGRPTDTFQGDHRAYHDFAAKLCEQGYITFAPQNPYIFQDRFRTLQRKANPLGKTLFSVIVPQHQQIVNWLKTVPGVDPDRIAFYGLSYGGKSAMRIPALVTDYCLSICSADFNEWVRKNASTRDSFSYVWTGEYEIFEWNLGSTFNYFEMAALICPRPFMVERGHFDGVGVDHWVAYEYAKVRNLYAAQLKIPERTEIEWFEGPHTINGQGTFAFLNRHLNWTPRSANE